MNHEKIIGTIGYLGGIPALLEPFTWSWGLLCAHTTEVMAPGEHIHYDRAKMSLHDYARAELLARMRGDWILMLDTDISFEPDLAARMVWTMNRFNVDVLTGVYVYKHPPHYPVLYRCNKATDKFEIIGDFDRSSEIFRVDGAGAGVLLVRRRVFERITTELRESPFDRSDLKGEDFSFFRRLMRLNIPTWCAWKIQVQHLEIKGFGLEDFEPPDKFAGKYETEAIAV